MSKEFFQNKFVHLNQQMQYQKQLVFIGAQG